MLELWEKVEAEWGKIDARVCQDLVNRMLASVQAVIEVKRGLYQVLEYNKI